MKNFCASLKNIRKSSLLICCTTSAFSQTIISRFPIPRQLSQVI